MNRRHYSKRCGVKIYRYATREKVGSRETLAGQPITVEGCTYRQIEETVKQTVEMIEKLSVLGEAGAEKITYPHEALHEIITNAVLHRDYSIADDIHVRIFENRIEVESPGRLPATVRSSERSRPRPTAPAPGRDSARPGARSAAMPGRGRRRWASRRGSGRGAPACRCNRRGPGGSRRRRR